MNARHLAEPKPPIRRRLRGLIPLPRLAATVTTFVAAFAALGVTAAVGEPRVASERLQMQREVTLYGSDEFSGPAGTRPNPAMWRIETGGGGWGNHEQQVYTEDPSNVRIDGAGHLVIEAVNVEGDVTSARISSLDRVDFKRGMIQARIKMPAGQGIHPAFWMLGTSISQVGYPASGEIDVAELVNSDGIVHAAVHGPWISASPRPVPKWKMSADTHPPTDPSGDFHIYWIRKEPGSITVGIDESAYTTFRKSDMPDGGKWVQDLPFYLLFNVAVGGDWPGALGPDALPAQMVVDWVPIYG